MKRIKNPFVKIAIRWFVNSMGLWIATNVFNKISYNDRIHVIIIAGLVLSLINAVIRPLIVILSLPAILITLGLFMFIVNGFMVFLVSRLYPSLEVASFGAAIIAGFVIGVVNYLVTLIVEEYGADKR